MVKAVNTPIPRGRGAEWTQSRRYAGSGRVLSASFPNKSRADGWPGVVCRYNHDDEFLLGTTRSGTLRLSIDETGLNYDVNVPECRK